MPQASRRPPRPSLLRYWGSALSLAIGVAGVNAATASAPKPVAPSGIAAMDLGGLKSSHSYTPALGESLERIVAKTMPESPLSAQVLSQAFVLLNPQAFSSSKPQRTQSTAALKVPNHNQLLQLVLARHPAEPALARAPEPLAAKAATAALRSAENARTGCAMPAARSKSPPALMALPQIAAAGCIT